ITAQIVAYHDDPRMYDALPDLPDVPVGAPTEPLSVTITNEDGPTVNLRNLASVRGYVGVVSQQVTFILPEDVDVAIVRGTWPTASGPILSLAGYASGLTGTPGVGGLGGTPNPGVGIVGDGFVGGPGGPGGTAIDASSGPLKVTGGGTIRGGKG